MGRERTRGRSLARGATCALLLAAACTGSIRGSEPGGKSSPPPRPMPPDGMTMTGGQSGGNDPGPAPAGAGRLRLLTRAQLENSLHDLLGDIPVGETEADTIAAGFASVGATYATISPHGVEQYETALLAALSPLFADPARRTGLVGCTPQGPADQACVRRFVTDFGRRAWRRPLTPAEGDRYVQLALAAASTLNDVGVALMHTTSALLASPNFLYRVELGQPEGGRFRYTGWEMASRLSYFLWNTTPDVELLAAAEAGKLTTPDGLRAQVARLLGSPRARGFADNFGRELVGLDDLAETPKNDPRFTPTLKEAMRAEVVHLFESRLESGADALDLYDGTGAFVNAELAAVYGIPGITGTAPVAAQLPASIPRAGLLGTAAFLSLQSKQDATSPTARGKFVREQVLCEEVPDPPDNLDTTLKDPPPGAKLTLREHMEMHRSNPVCASCHALIDPLGYPFESFDWIGAYREKDNGKPIDSSGALDGVPFANARELAAALRRSPKTQDCMLRNIFRYASGHRETAADEAELRQWKKTFEASGHRLVAFLTEIAADDGFRTVSSAP
jgi:Protein of unknown function (DUF1592)/Protein of unknown function (DUF1588)/Protein of unknown function (DUF1595)/Protein of unknown function (DUF1585)/Protein of unknown function (DUF1587)